MVLVFTVFSRQITGVPNAQQEIFNSELSKPLITFTNTKWNIDEFSNSKAIFFEKITYQIHNPILNESKKLYKKYLSPSEKSDNQNSFNLPILDYFSHSRFQNIFGSIIQFLAHNLDPPYIYSSFNKYKYFKAFSHDDWMGLIALEFEDIHNWRVG